MQYDWRSRFHIPLSDVLTGAMPWQESWALASELLKDPSSHTAAALNGWEHPFSREAFIAADAYDLQQYIATDAKKRSAVKPYPRPGQARKAHSTGMTQEQVDKVLASLGHDIPGQPKPPAGDERGRFLRKG